MAARTADKLTEARIRAAKAGPRGRKLADGHGLYLYVSPTDCRSWRYDYTFRETDPATGEARPRAKTLTLGTYPEIGLREAREAHAEARRTLARGISPAAAKREARDAPPAPKGETFRELAEEFLGRHSRRVRPSTLKVIRSDLERNAFPALGGREAASVRPRELLLAFSPLEEAGHPGTCNRMIGLCGQIYRYGISTGRDLTDISSGIRTAVPAPPAAPMAAITAPDAFGGLLRAIDGYHGGAEARGALRLLPYVFVRPAELTGARWAEIDLEAGMWIIPAARMKSGRAHAVPLSAQARALFAGQRELSGGGPYVFPNRRDPSRPMGRQSILLALRKLGYAKGEMTAHGFRAAASTMLNSLGFNPDWIERQLAHAERNPVRAAYNRADYLQERAGMMQDWADHVDGLRAAAAAAGGGPGPREDGRCVGTAGWGGTGRGASRT
jgi:integrase